jgi:hypothetical protein
MRGERFHPGLLALLSLNVAATILHYLDNMAHLPAYGEPAWVTPHLIDGFWFVMTPLAVLGYALIIRGRTLLGSLSLHAYAAASLLVLLHYSLQPMSLKEPCMAATSRA